MGFVERKKSGNIFAGSRLVVDGQGIYNVKIIKPGFERQKSPLEYFRPIVFPKPVPAPLCDFNGVIFMTPTPTPTITPTITPTNTITPTPSCNCTYIDVTITEMDLELATFNTNPENNGAVYVKYGKCSGGLTSERFTVAGVYLNAICGNSGITPGVTYFANNSQEVGSSTADNNGQCCTPPTPTPTPTNTITPTITPTETLTPTPTVTPSATQVFQFLPNGFYFTDEVNNDTFAYIYGEFTGYTYNNTPVNRLVKLNQDLTIDYSFTGGTGFNASPFYFAYNSITQQPDGKIIATGSFTQYSGVSANRIIRLNTDGSIDGTFTYGTGFNSFTEGTGVDSLGRIIVLGFFTSYNGTPSTRIVRLNSNGSYDGTFTIGTGFNNTTIEVLMNSDDSMYITGYFNIYNGTSTPQGITKLLSTGVIDTTFSGGTGFNTGNNQPNGLMRISGETSFYTFGYFTLFNGISVNRIIKLNSDGTQDMSFNSGTGFNDTVIYGYVIWTNKLLLIGSFTSYNGTLSNGTILLNSDGTIYQTFSTKYQGVFFIGSKLFGQPTGLPIELIATYP